MKRGARRSEGLLLGAEEEKEAEGRLCQSHRG